MSLSDVQIFTSILVPAITNGPSTTALQWSEDGQAFIVTRGAIYILTPNTGINFDPSSVIHSSLSQSTDENVKIKPLSWYKTMIELEKTPAHQWPLESQEWGTVSLGSLDMSWCSVAVSPSNLSKECSCFLVALNTNLEVSLWMPGSNYLTGEWIKVQDVTQVLRESDFISSNEVLRTLNAQVHSISWSQQVDFGEGMLHVDASLLALGNRAGRVIFMQLSSTNESQRLGHVTTFEVSNDWVHHLTWSVWRKISSSHFQAFLACGIADGSIVIISVSLFLESSSDVSVATHRFHFQLQNEGKSCCSPDSTSITALTWVESKQHAPILVYTKPGLVYLQPFSSDLPLGWTERRALTLKLQPLSSSSTSYAAASGFVYDEQQDALVLCLYDGSFHIIRAVTTSPTIYQMDPSLSSEELTRQARSVFAISEGAISFAHANRTSGVCNYDGSGTVMWLHEKCKPEDFSYNNDAKNVSMFIVTRLWKDDAFFFERLGSQFARDFHFEESPVHTLRSVFLHLRDMKFLEEQQDLLIEFLAQDCETKQTSFTRSTGEISGLGEDADQLLKLQFRHRLTTDLFRSRHIRLLRLKSILATFCSKSVQQNVSLRFVELAEQLSNHVLCLYMQTVIRQVDTVVYQLREQDRTFVHRWVTQCLFQGSRSLQDEAVALAGHIGVPTGSVLESRDFQEQCPACHALIPLENGSRATCPNGHVWARCSITSFLLATPFVRTCVGCCRKALLPPSLTTNSMGWGQALPPAAGGWVVQELLEAVKWCIFCGNRFVRLL